MRGFLERWTAMLYFLLCFFVVFFSRNNFCFFFLRWNSWSVMNFSSPVTRLCYGCAANLSSGRKEMMLFPSPLIFKVLHISFDVFKVPSCSIGRLDAESTGISSRPFISFNSIRFNSICFQYHQFGECRQTRTNQPNGDGSLFSQAESPWHLSQLMRYKRGHGASPSLTSISARPVWRGNIAAFPYFHL